MQGPEPRDSIFERAQLGLDQAADSHGVPSPADEEGHRLPNLLKRKPELLRRTNELQSVDDTLGVDAVVVREALGRREEPPPFIEADGFAAHPRASRHIPNPDRARTLHRDLVLTLKHATGSTLRGSTRGEPWRPTDGGPRCDGWSTHDMARPRCSRSSRRRALSSDRGPSSSAWPLRRGTPSIGRTGKVGFER